MKSQLLLGLSFMVGLSSLANAANVIEGFEDTADPLDWRATSPSPQTHNVVANPSIPVYSQDHVTEGVNSGEFSWSWLIGGDATDAATNYYESAGPLRLWAIRFNVNAPSGVPTNNIPLATGHLTADVYNNNPYPVSVSLVCDTAISTGLERGPLQEIPANSSAVYDWDMVNVPPVGWITGDGSFNGASSARLKTLLVYTTTEPTVATCDLYFDNIQDQGAGGDVTPPAIPVPLSAVQGSTPGSLDVSWIANTDSDLGGYNIYLSTDDNFSSPVVNRLVFPSTPIASVGPTVLNTTISVPTDQDVYVAVQAIDNASPPNASEYGLILGAHLNGDGSAVQDHVIIDYDRQPPGQANFAIEGYAQGIVYNGKALTALSRSFDSATANAVEIGAFNLTPSPTGMVIWSNLLDGLDTGNASSSISDGNIAKLNTFLGDTNANLMISGAAVASDLTNRATDGSSYTFISDKLGAIYLTNVANAQIDGADDFAAMGTVHTNNVIYDDEVAYSSTHNEQLYPNGTNAVGGGFLSGDTTVQYPIIGNNNQTVLMGFAFEAIGADSIANTNMARQNLMHDVIVYLLGAAGVQDWTMY